MPTNENDRFNYHPDPTTGAGGSGRRVDQRREAIEARVDLNNRSMIDFGCSGGYFGFAWAKRLAAYRGIDGDADLIARNNAAATKLGLGNVAFQHAEIDAAFVRGLEKADVALFLSVFHHILAVSSAYAWNRAEQKDPWDIVRAMREKVEVLVFEIGYPDEGFDWCAGLPAMGDDPRAWVSAKLKECGFKYVEVIRAADIYGPASALRRTIAMRTGVVKRPKALSSRLIQRIVRHDSRDDRDVFIAR